jgi:hypothetical protein
VTGTGLNIDQWQAIQFSVISDATKGIALNTTYYVFFPAGQSNTFQLYSDYALTTLVNITADGLTGTWATVNMSIPKYFTYDGTYYWMIDSAGLVWSNTHVTNFNSWWTYSGNKANNKSGGNGIVYYGGFIFVFSGGSIDYCPISTGVWVYQWAWLAGTAGSWNANPTDRFKSNALATIHEAMVGTDNRVYFVDGSWIGAFYQTAVGTAFNPADIATYTAQQTMPLPITDTAQCITQMGTNIYIGGTKNVIYPWDRFSSTNSYPIQIAEFNIVKLVTVNTNVFIFTGNRGRIYYTNGTNAQLYKKIPDHLSGTVEPYYIWGGVCSNKNQLYFSAYATDNAGTAIVAYGGVWAIDLDTKAIRLTNKLSYGTYGGYSTSMIPDFAVSSVVGTPNPTGSGFFIGWNSGASTYGVDKTVGTPYVSGEAYVDSDLVPIGTYLKPTTNGRVEFKLSVPMVTGERVQLLYRQKFSDSFTAITGGTFSYSSATGAINYAGVCQSVNFQNSQWIQIRAILTSTASTPSYCRLTELRLGN